MKMITLGLSILFWSNMLALQLLPVQFNFEAGVYSTPISLALSSPETGTQIYYTLDGSEPTTSDNLYVNPITILNLNGTPNNYASIPTNPSFNFPIGNYTTLRANNRGWLPPYSEVQKATIIRAKAFKTNYDPSFTVSKTYLINALGAARYSLPIVSLVVDSTDFFSDLTGIYVYGDHPDGNYTQKDSLWERITHFELIENGTLVYNQSARARVHGGGSRHSGKKNLRLYGKTGENTNFKYPFFEDTEIDKFKRIILRSGGHRADCFPRDDLSQLITDGLNIEKQHFKNIIVFINGEYWGVHSLKERVDNYFIQNLYGIDDDMITILDQEYDMQGNGHSADSLEMDLIESYIVTNDMSIDSNYSFVEDRVDIDNYIDYMCSEIYLSNSDWVFSNVVIWRKTGAYDPTAGAGYDGKFRWLLYDLDGGFGGSCSNAFYTVNTLNAATISSGIYTSYTRFFRGLLENPKFKDKFINRMCDLLNSWFKPEVVNGHMNNLRASLTPEMLENVDRWRYPSVATNLADRNVEIPSLTQWDTIFYYFNRFANRRPRKQREHIISKWNISDSSHLTADVNDIQMGYVKVNTLLLNASIPGTSSAVYPWVGVYMDSIDVPLKAIAKPGYKFLEWENTGITQSEILWTPSGDSTYTAVFDVDPSYMPVVINEVMLRNSDVYQDNFNEYDDWTELFNPNSSSIDLSGCKITKGGDEWIIPNNTIIAPFEYLIFWNDKQTYQGANHLNFKLQNISDIIFLKSPEGFTLDSLSYTSTSKNQSYGRSPNGSNTYIVFDDPTPKFSNDLSGISFAKPLQELIAYPNPATNLVSFNKRISFRLMDVLGKEVLQASNVYQFDATKLNNGIYILITESKETIKVIIQK